MSKAKATGTAAETAVVRYLQANGLPAAERRALSGALDKGDIAGIAHVCIEVKAAVQPQLKKWFAETRTEAANAGALFYMLVVKVKYKPVGRWDAWLPVAMFNEGVSFSAQEDWTWVRCDLQLAAELLRQAGC